MVDEVKSMNTTFAMNDRLLHMIPHRGDKAYNTLIASLKFGSGQTHLVDLLENTVLLNSGT